MDSEVALILGKENILLWKCMFKAVDYPDLGVVEEFKQGSELIDCVIKTGLWPPKLQPAIISKEELHSVATIERDALQQQFSGVGRHAEEVWRKTMEEVEAGTLVGPIDLREVPADYPPQ